MESHTASARKGLDCDSKARTVGWLGLLKESTIQVLMVSLLAGMLAIWWYTSRLQVRLIESMALENARAYTQVLRELRTLYASEVASRIKAAGIETAQDYEKKTKTIPVPTKLIIRLGEALSRQDSSVQARLYSVDPSISQKKTEGVHDRFAKEAWDSLMKNPDQPVFHFENIQGRRSLRYATAWREEETKGILEVTLLLEGFVAQPNTNKFETFGVLGGLGVLGLLMLFVVIGRVRHGLEESKQRAAVLEAEIAERERVQRALEKEIAERKRTEQEILAAVDVLTSATSDILTATTELATNATEMATAVNETTTTVEQVKQTAALSSQKAQQVSATAHKAAQISKSGKKATEDTISEMQRIRNQMQAIADSILQLSEQSQVIREITDTVNDLAEQSNILAVNASIEAQKAGVHGSGFTVVAQEVRTLAQQSKEATAQVQAILNDIEKATSVAVQITTQGAKAAEVGMKQSVEAGESIRTLAQSVEEGAQSATLIATSNQQQAIGMDQLVQAMFNIQAGSIQAVTNTKRVETSAQKLHELGQKLKNLGGQLASSEEAWLSDEKETAMAA